jgi:hypothetical protein
MDVCMTLEHGYGQEIDFRQQVQLGTFRYSYIDANDSIEVILSRSKYCRRIPNEPGIYISILDMFHSVQ